MTSAKISYVVCMVFVVCISSSYQQLPENMNMEGVLPMNMNSPPYLDPANMGWFSPTGSEEASVFVDPTAPVWNGEFPVQSQDVMMTEDGSPPIPIMANPFLN